MFRNEVLSNQFQSSAVFVADPARKRAGHSLTELAVASIALIAIGGHGALHAETPTANIVGLGATTCSTFRIMTFSKISASSEIILRGHKGS